MHNIIIQITNHILSSPQHFVLTADCTLACVESICVSQLIKSYTIKLLFLPYKSNTCSISLEMIKIPLHMHILVQTNIPL